MNLRHSLWSTVTVCDSTSVIQSNTRGPGRCGDDSWQEVMWHEALTCWTRRRCRSGRLAGSARWRHARLGRRLRRENAARHKTAGLGPTPSRTGALHTKDDLTLTVGATRASRHADPGFVAVNALWLLFLVKRSDSHNTYNCWLCWQISTQV